LLAYVFWHSPRPGVVARDYEGAHQAFHDALWQSGCPGLRGVRVFALPLIPWLPLRPAGYEDWHFIDGSPALDTLNEAAVTSTRQVPHDRVAAMAADGIAGLYGLRAGSLIKPSIACWLSKPAGMSYAEFEASLQPLTDHGCCLWGRRMTLGPTPEFCLHAPDEVTLPHVSQTVRLSERYSRGLE